MPRSLEPGLRIVCVIECDKDKTPQPKAIGKSLNISQARKLMSSMDAMKKATTSDTKIECAIDAAMSVLIGWENMTDPDTGFDIPFGRESLQEVYSIEELTEILSIAAGDGRLSADDRKKSVLPVSSAVVNSVPDALAVAMGS